MIRLACICCRRLHIEEQALKIISVVQFTAISWLLGMPFIASAGLLSEEEAVATALAGNQGIAAMDSHAEAMSHVPAQAGALPDPELSFGAINLPTDTFSTTAENMTQMQLGLSQKIPFPGKRRLSEQAAGFEADSAHAESNEVRLRIERDVRSAWWSLVYLDRSLGIVARNKTLLRQFIKIAESKYKTGQGIQSDLLLAQVELSKLLDTEIALKASRQRQQSNLNTLLNRAPGTAIEIPAQLNEFLPRLPDQNVLYSMAAKFRPLLAAQQSRVNASKSRSELAEKDYYPDFTLSGTYGWRNGMNPATGRSRPDMASVRLGITLPLYAGDRQSRAVQQHKADAAKEGFALNDLTRMVENEVYQAWTDYHANREQALLFKSGVIPQARQTVASMRASYQVNKVDFLNLVQAQVTLYNYETQYWKAISSGKQAKARLEASVGRKISKETVHE